MSFSLELKILSLHGVGQLKVYSSIDSCVEDSQSHTFPVEFLNSLNLSGLPPHKLYLKLGMPVILLRNLSPQNGLCNGTRLICRRFYMRTIECEIAIGDHAGQTVLIPRLPLIPYDTGLPFDFCRIQFPIKPAFALTINKAQGQTLEKVGLWLEKPVFSHGQLYVALSRVSNFDKIQVC